MKKTFLRTFLALGLSMPSFAEDTVWQALVNTTTTVPTPGGGSTLSKNAGTAAFNAGAASVQLLTGDGAVEFRFDQIDKRMAVGLHFSNPDEGYTTLDYGFVANTAVNGTLSGQTLLIRENGTNTAWGTFQTTDVLKIERVGNLIKYWKNGVLITSSAVNTVGTLLVDTSFCEVGGSISGCKITSGPLREDDIQWSAINTNVVVSNPTPDQGSKLTHGTTAGWGGAISFRKIPGDGYAKFKIPVTAKRVALGFSATDNLTTADVVNIPYGIEATGTTNNYRVFDPSGTLTTGTFAVTDLFSIYRTGTTVTFYKNGTLLATSTVALSGAIFVDTALYTASAALANCRVGGLSSAEPVSWVGADNRAVLSNTVAGEIAVQREKSGAAWDVGVSSFKKIPRSGGFSFRFFQIDKQMAAGLSTADADTGLNSIQLGIQALGNGSAQAVESGTLQGSPISFTSADVFTVWRSAGSVSYLKNGTAFHQHALVGSVATDELLVDTSFYHYGAKIEGGQLTGAPEDVFWRDVTATADVYDTTPGAGTAIAKTNTSTAWNTQGVSVQRFTGDGYIEVRPKNQGSRRFIVGLTTTDNDLLDGFLVSIDFNTGSTYTFWQNGTSSLGTGTYANGDIFRIERKGKELSLYRVGDAASKVTVTAGFESLLFLDSAFTSAGNAAGTANGLTNAQVYIAAPDSDDDGLADSWEYRYFQSLDSAQQSGGVGFENDYDHDGVSNAAEFAGGTDPLDYYNGLAPDLRIVSGDGQTTMPGSVVPFPLVIEVRDDASVNAPLLPDAPVTFGLQAATGGNAGTISASSGGTYAGSQLSFRSNLVNGQAQVWFKQPTTPGTTNTVRVTSVGGGNVVKDFKIYSHYLALVWLLDEASGTSTSDSSPIAPQLPMSLVSTTDVTRVPGLGASGNYSVNDRALQFNGTTSSFAFYSVGGGNNPTAKLGYTQLGNAFSATAWVKLPTTLTLAAATDIYPVMSTWIAAGTGFELVLKGGSGNGLAFRIYNNSVVTKEIEASQSQVALLKDGFAHMVAFTRDTAGLARLYVDGLEVGQQSSFTGSVATANSAGFWLARNTAGKLFNGVIDEVRVYASTLSPAEVLAARQAFDSDADGLPDAWEKQYFGNISKTAAGDDDTGGGDGLTNLQEYHMGLKPNVRDTDGDGLEDGGEVAIGANPLGAPVEDLNNEYIQLNIHSILN